MKNVLTLLGMFYALMFLSSFALGVMFSSTAYGFTYFIFWGTLTPLILWIETKEKTKKGWHDENQA